MKKSIMVCVDLNEESMKLFTEDLDSWDWQNIKKVHLVHGFRLLAYTGTFYFNSYPGENQYEEIEASVRQVLMPLEEKAKEACSDVTVSRRCIIARAPKESLCAYAKKEKIDSMIVGTRGKHGIAGFFSSSFAEYMVGHAPCELRVIRGD